MKVRRRLKWSATTDVARLQSRVLIIGEYHLAYFEEAILESKSEEEALTTLALLEETAGLVRGALTDFNPTRIYREARPTKWKKGLEILRSQVPDGIRVLQVEAEDSPTPGRMTYHEREAGMAERLYAFLVKNQGSRVALVCGAKHAVNVARNLVKRSSGKFDLRVEVRFVMAEPIRRMYPKLHDQTFETPRAASLKPE
jgi:hypothetical protein